MPISQLKHHLLVELVEEIFEWHFDMTPFYDCAGDEDEYFINSSDSEDYEEHPIYAPEHKDTHQVVYADLLIQFALSGDIAFRAFVKFIRNSLTVRFRKKEVYLHHNDRTLALESEHDAGMNPFFKFARKASFYKLEMKNTAKQTAPLVQTMNKFTDLRHMDLSKNHGIPNMALRQMSEVFANLTDFDVPAGLFNILVGKFKTKFPYLQRLKLLGEMKDINKVTTAPECFPNLQVIEVSLPFDYYNQYKSSDLVFTHPLPTVKELSITLEEISDDGFVDADLQLVKDWLSKFPSLTKAKISLEKSVRNYPLTDSPDRYTQLHDLFKSIDFGVPLDLSFTADGRVPYPNYVDPDEVPEDEIDLDDLAPYFEYYERPFIYFNHTHGFSTERFVYKYAMPGKKFEHKINLDLEM